ncbi:hypothetical protein ACVWZZ_002843 [Bradyrhizobium sp. LM6.10]
MAALATVRKSSLHNALEGLALTATLQSFPTFAAAAFLLKLVGNHDLVGDPGVAIFVAIDLARPCTACGDPGAELPGLVQDHLCSRPSTSQSPSRPICRSPTRSPRGAPSPVASLQLMTIVLLLSVMAVVTASVG